MAKSFAVLEKAQTVTAEDLIARMTESATGWDDLHISHQVVLDLVERANLTSGSTFHSAGLVGQLRSSLSLTKMMMERNIRGL